MVLRTGPPPFSTLSERRRVSEGGKRSRHVERGFPAGLDSSRKTPGRCAVPRFHEVGASVNAWKRGFPTRRGGRGGRCERIDCRRPEGELSQGGRVASKKDLQDLEGYPGALKRAGNGSYIYKLCLGMKGGVEGRREKPLGNQKKGEDALDQSLAGEVWNIKTQKA